MGIRVLKTNILRRPESQMEETSMHKLLAHVKKPSESGGNPGLPGQQWLMEANRKERL